MYEANYFEKKDGCKVYQIDIMELMSEALHSEQLNGKNYSSLLNKSVQATENTYMKSFEELEEEARKYYYECRVRANNKDRGF